MQISDCYRNDVDAAWTSLASLGWEVGGMGIIENGAAGYEGEIEKWEEAPLPVVRAPSSDARGFGDQVHAPPHRYDAVLSYRW